MRLPLVTEFLMEQSSTGLVSETGWLPVRCPWCDYEGTSHDHLSIKIDVEDGEAMGFRCFRADCGKKGILNTEVLKKMGCIDPATLAELSNHNRNVAPYVEKDFDILEKADVRIVNLPVGDTKEKMRYVRQRLGVNFTYEQLTQLKIQLSIKEMLRLNDLRKLAASKGRLNMLDVYGIGFVSAFDDYLIVRDITPDMKTGRRYYNYKIGAKGADDPSSKIYAIPRQVDLLDPKSCVINVAEGAFSIIGAYLNTDLGGERPNNVWLANCGSEFENTILRVVKQYGFLKVRINIFSDSEIKLDKYRKLYNTLKNRMDIRRMTVYYNERADDFGHARKDIKINEISIHRKGEDS